MLKQQQSSRLIRPHQNATMTKCLPCLCTKVTNASPARESIPPTLSLDRNYVDFCCSEIMDLEKTVSLHIFGYCCNSPLRRLSSLRQCLSRLAKNSFRSCSRCEKITPLRVPLRLLSGSRHHHLLLLLCKATTLDNTASCCTP